MFPTTAIEPRDDPAFLAVVDQIVATLARRDQPDEVYLIHINNWFDHKWLKYSGYGMIAFPGGYPWLPTAKAEHYQGQLTFPPFPPNRVVAQFLFCRVAVGVYEEQAPAHLIHVQRRQRSAKNLQRRVADFSRSALFVWYSSRSSETRRGSLLVYNVRDDDVAAWYAGFSERQGWQLDKVKGIDRKIVRLLVAGELPKQSSAE